MSMPNWCANRVAVWSNDEEAMKKFKEGVKLYDEGKLIQWLSFHAILPMPEELRNVQSPVTIATEEQQKEYTKKHNRPCPYITQEESDRLDGLYDSNNWYDWSIENWGVKWDCGDVEITEEFGDTEITYTFDTPWGPPQEIYDLLVTKFPEIHISWFWDEPGMELAGYLK